MTEQYEYLAMVRNRHPEGEWGLWRRIGNRQAYATLSAARAMATQERNEAERYKDWRLDTEVKIMRRPIGTWEDFE
jgi:hypothetical protein